MTRQEFLCDYWNYYLSLEKRFLHTLNYVELHRDNRRTFSNEYASLMQIICAELDSFFKVYCGFKPDDRKTINDYATSVLASYPNIVAQEISVYDNKFIIKPFDGWNTTTPAESLDWWMAYNNIKHSRVANKKVASQIKTLKALAALFLIEMKYLSVITDGTKELDIPDEQSTLFSLKNWSFRNISARDLFLELSDGEVIISG